MPNPQETFSADITELDKGKKEAKDALDVRDKPDFTVEDPRDQSMANMAEQAYEAIAKRVDTAADFLQQALNEGSLTAHEARVVLLMINEYMNFLAEQVADEHELDLNLDFNSYRILTNLSGALDNYFGTMSADKDGKVHVGSADFADLVEAVDDTNMWLGQVGSPELAKIYQKMYPELNEKEALAKAEETVADARVNATTMESVRALREAQGANK